MSQDDFVKLENVAVTYGRDAAHAVTAQEQSARQPAARSA